MTVGITFFSLTEKFKLNNNNGRWKFEKFKWKNGYIFLRDLVNYPQYTEVDNDDRLLVSSHFFELI